MAERILIDGRSGSGKTELAAALIEGWPAASPPHDRPALTRASEPAAWAQLVRLDDLYPGWDGLDAGSAAVPGILLTGVWRAWDWARDRPGGEHRLDPGRPIVIEGAGAASRAARALADMSIWVELDEPTRKRRALQRDGELYAPHWERWARQEAAYVARERPAEHVDMIVDGGDAALDAVLDGLRR